MEYSLQSAIGFSLFVFLFALSFVFWRFMSTKSTSKNPVSSENDSEIKHGYNDFSQLLDKSKDKDYLNGTTSKYSWLQNEREIEITVPIAGSISRKELKCVFNPGSLTLVHNTEEILNGELYAEVIPAECNWQIGKSYL